MVTMLAMAKNPIHKSQGRPKAESPKRVLISFRIDEKVAEAIEVKRVKMGVISFSLSDTVREMMLRQLKDDGII